MSTLRSKLVTGAAVAAAAVGGATIANAATSDNTATNDPAPQSQGSGPGGPGGRHSVGGRTEQALTGTTESKVRASALAKVPGTVERVETNVDGSAPYEAHIRKSDGTEVEVQVNKDFTVSDVNEMGAMGGGRP